MNQMHRAAFMIGLLLARASLYAVAEPFKVYMIGNSLTDEVKYDNWIKLCAAGGKEALYARKNIPGAPISWHQEHPTDGFSTKPYGYPDTAFRDYPWDALTLQPFSTADREIPAALHYANLMWEKNPQARIYVYAQWPNRSSDDWTARWQEYREGRYEPVLQALRKQTAHADQVFMIPVGWAMNRLHKKMELGLVPGYRSAWDLFTDGVHVSNVGSYIVGLGYYATLFGQSPVGLPVGDYQGKKGTDADYFTISPELARILQETVWEAVTAHPDSGVKTDIPVAITLPGLMPAVEKEPYRYELDAAFGTPPYLWAQAGGQLPAELRLTASGWLEGTPAKQGSFSFTAKVTDANGQIATRDFTLDVGADAAPQLSFKQLPALRQGQFLALRLEATGGNGALNWSLSGGALPAGLILEKNGQLSGSPAQEGPYEVTFTVADSDGARPETASVTCKGTIAAADPKTVFFAKKAAAKIEIDGVFDPSEGWNLERKLEKPLLGQSDNTVRFDVQFKDKFLYVAVEVEDASLQTSGAPFDADSLVFYFDGLNNREATYNFDDRQIVLGLGDTALDRKNTIGPGEHVRSKSVPTATGFRLEARFKLGGMGVPDQIPGGSAYNPEWAVIGFDLVNHDLDAPGNAPARLGWQGTVDNPVNPSQFGTLILRP
jgi:hypothetical protein